ncbi:hypothetical protein B1693_08095 [Geobacillus zalihae]|nr:hypothetical protein B1693_08095 [Geobacillus zalihae]
MLEIDHADNLVICTKEGAPYAAKRAAGHRAPPESVCPDPCCSVHSSSVQRVVFMGVLGPVWAFGPPAGR